MIGYKYLYAIIGFSFKNLRKHRDIGNGKRSRFG